MVCILWFHLLSIFSTSISQHSKARALAISKSCANIPEAVLMEPMLYWFNSALLQRSSMSIRPSNWTGREPMRIFRIDLAILGVVTIAIIFDNMWVHTWGLFKRTHSNIWDKDSWDTRQHGHRPSLCLLEYCLSHVGNHHDTNFVMKCWWLCEAVWS